MTPGESPRRSVPHRQRADARKGGEPSRQGDSRRQDRRPRESHRPDCARRNRNRDRRQRRALFERQMRSSRASVLVFRDVTEKRREEDRRRFLAEASALLACFELGLRPDAHERRQAGGSRYRRLVRGRHGRPRLDGRAPGRRTRERGEDSIRDGDRDAIPVRSPSPPHGVHEVIRSGGSILMSEIPDLLWSKPRSTTSICASSVSSG